MLFLISYYDVTCPSAKCDTISSNCVSNPIKKTQGNPLVEFVHSDFDPNYQVNGETHIEIYEKPKTVVNLPIDDVEGYIRENDFGNLAQAKSIIKHISLTNSFKRSFNIMKCDDTKYEFDKLPAASKTYENFWNKNLSLSFLLVKGVKHAENNTVTLKLKKVSGSIKKRKAEKLTKTSSVDTNVCYYIESCKGYKKVFHDGFCVKPGYTCSPVKYQRERKQVKATEKFTEIKYQFPSRVTWTANEISELYQQLHDQMEERIFIY